MRQWSVAHSQQPLESPDRKRRPAGLSMRVHTNIGVPAPLPGAEEDAEPVGRLSRHIPQRDGADMAVSAYNLLSLGGEPAAPAPGFGRMGMPGVPAPSSAMTPSSSVYTSFSESQISDDSSNMTSLYNDMLADKLSSREAEGGSGGAYGGQRLALGGEVLQFAAGGHTSGEQNSSSQLGRPLLGRRHYRSADDDAFALPLHHHPHPFGGARGAAAPQRVLCTNPERVLDAPEFPNHATQLMHWGSNNRLVIGLKNSLFTWDAATGQADKLADMHEDFTIRCVSWLHKCACVALAVNGGTTAIYDCRSEDFLRQIRLPAGAAEVTGLAVNGPILAVATSGEAGGCYVHDLRSRNSLTCTFEGHRGPVTSLQYSPCEPYYLATGGADGAVRVWDARKPGCPRYAFDGVHCGAVTALHWNPERRSKIFTGGADSVLCMVDTHARAADGDALEEEGLAGLGGGGPARQFVARAVKTHHPISGIVCGGDGGELVTAHRGKGQLQLRRTSNFHLLGVFSAPSCEADLSCLTLAPDRERVCAAQGDETLKFWKVFQDNTRQRGQGRREETFTDPYAMMGGDALR